MAKFNEEIVRADVLCIGGGIAGLMAAIRASELGAKVVVAEKGNALHSGRGRAGNDHFWCYIPEVHGTDMEEFLRECLKGPKMRALQMGTSSKVLRAFLAKSFDIVKLWDSWGIPMRYHDKWEFAGHSFPGEVLTHLKYEGQGQKAQLIKQAASRGAEIINRVMIVDLLAGTNGIAGAIGVDTRKETLFIFEAKSVILGTGYVDRLYPQPVPGYIPSSPGMPTLTGDGRAMAHRAGAELAGMEMFRRHVGSRYFARFGQATWVGVLRDPSGKPLGPFVSQPDRRYGDMTAEVSSMLLEEYMKSGNGPVYMDCTGISNEDHEYMRHWLMHEGNVALLNYMDEEGIDLRKNPIEFGTLQITPEGKVWVNERAETAIKGLYSAGDESMGSIGPAATYGWISGDSAANYARENASGDIEQAKGKVEEIKYLIETIRSRKAGPDWREANMALQRIMQDYAGMIRSESLLEAGLNHLKKLKDKARDTLVAANQWELTRALETLNLLDLGEIILIAANERKETRGLHKRSDYPLTNPMLEDKVLFIKNVAGKPVAEWRKAE